MKKEKLKRIKSLSTIILLIIYLVVIQTVSFASATSAAANTATLTLESTKRSIAPNDSFMVTVNLSNITIPSGAYRIEMKLDVTDGVVEDIKTSDLVGGESWRPTYNSSTKIITLNRSDYAKEDQKGILKITFKAKSAFGSAAGSTDLTSSSTAPTELEIGLSNIKLNRTNDVQSVSTKIGLGQSIDQSGGATVIPDTTGTVVTDINNITINPDDANRPTVNPEAGLDDTITLILIVLGGIAIVSFISVRKLSGK